MTGSGRARLHNPANRLAIALGQDPELRQLLFAEVFVPICDVTHGVVEPVLLVLGEGVDHAAAEYVAEKLIAGLGERSRLRGATGFLFDRAPSLLGVTNSSSDRGE
jgi:hypothetical protein